MYYHDHHYVYDNDNNYHCIYDSNDDSYDNDYYDDYYDNHGNNE